MPASITELVAVATVLYLLTRFFSRNQPFANLPGPSKSSWWKGCYSQFFDLYGWDFHLGILRKYGSVVKLPMLFGREELYVADPLALHHVLVKDQYTYEESPLFIRTNALSFGTSLLSTLGDHHRKQRKMLNPVFSLKHMRDLLPVFYPIAYDLRAVLIEKIKDEPKEIDLFHWLSMAALEFIGQAGFGHKFNALHDETAARYANNVKQVVALQVKTQFLLELFLWASNIGPAAFRRKLLELVPSGTTKEFIRVVDDLDEHSKVIYQEKTKALESGDEVATETVHMGKDILSVLMKANMMASEADRLPEEEIIGQLNTFTFAGQDTTSHALSRALHLLSLHQEVQTKLRNEIISARKAREGQDLDYDTLMGLPYLDAFCRETLRVYPPVPYLNRTTIKDVVMPLTWPILGADGKTEISEIPIKANTKINVSIIGANRSKKIWGEDAEDWKPERWLSPLPESVAKAHSPGVYSSMMTFLGGGRACIGFKFAEMEMKVVLMVLLETFEFAPGPELDWLMSGISKPVLKNSADLSPTLPLKVSLYRAKA